LWRDNSMLHTHDIMNEIAPTFYRPNTVAYCLRSKIDRYHAMIDFESYDKMTALTFIILEQYHFWLRDLLDKEIYILRRDYLNYNSDVHREVLVQLAHVVKMPEIRGHIYSYSKPSIQPCERHYMFNNRFI